MEVWRKKLKQKEEGREQRHFGAAAKAIEAQREKAPKPAPAADSAAPPRPAGPPSLYEMACSDPDREPDKVQQLYKALVEAKQKAGEKTDSLTLDGFQNFVRTKTQQLKQQAGAEQVEYSVTMEDGQVKLKARTK
jgi:hypothetical protein